MRHINNNGFSLTELMVVVAITGVISTAIMGFFISQQRSHTGQEQVTLMQQNARAGLSVMSRELRMAGFDTENPSVFKQSEPIFEPDLSQIIFKMNLTSNAVLTDPNERIKYYLGGPKGDTLLRKSPPNALIGQPLADGIIAVAFAFSYDSDNDGVLDVRNGNTYAIAGTDGLGPLDGTVNWIHIKPNGNLDTINTGPLAKYEDIRAVKIWLLARAENDSQEYTNTQTYIVGTQTISPTADNLHRRHLLLETVVRCRNMGL